MNLTVSSLCCNLSLHGHKVPSFWKPTVVSYRVCNKIKNTSIRQSSFQQFDNHLSPTSWHLDKFSTSHTLVSHCPLLHTGHTHMVVKQSWSTWLLPLLHPNSFISSVEHRAPLPCLFILTSRSKGLLWRIRWIGKTLKGKQLLRFGQ